MAGTPSQLKQAALFAKNFVRHPRMLGSVVPSSRFLTRRLLSRVDFDRARVIVEYGPGVGTFTQEILRRMRPDALLVVVETNPEFAEFLQHSISDRRLRVCHGSAASIREILHEMDLDRADYVISGIPLSTIPDRARKEILEATRSVLNPDGAFLVFQFSPRALPDLRRIFHQVERSFEARNIPPAQLYFCVP